MDKGKPIAGVEYALTGRPGNPSISNGNTWAESRVIDPMLWISTPSHGYLRVKHTTLFNEDWEISSFSYVDHWGLDPWVYLEEDCDAPAWLKHLYGENWIEESRKIEEKYIDSHIASEFEVIDYHDGRKKTTAARLGISKEKV